MIEKIQKTFHTDKWWGKTIFIILIYPIFWCIFYGSWFLLPDELFLERNSSSYQSLRIFVLLLIFILIPILSFFIPYIIKKTFKINKVFLYILHIVLVIFSVGLFVILSLVSALHNFQIG